jgi:ABC-2 type transport system permease protein
VVGLFIRLKLRLLAGNLRAGSARQIAFVLSICGATVLALLGFLELATLTTQPANVATERGIVTLTSLYTAWLLLPLLAFGQDETLDPTKLALFPLRPRQLAAGLLAASATGPWPLATLIMVCGAVIGLAGGPGGAALGLLAVPIFGGLCIVTARLTTTALSGLLRSRRGRDLVGVVMGLLILLAQLPNLLANQGVSADAGNVVHRVSRVTRWTPSGLVAHAISDGGLVGLVELTAVAILVVALTGLWVGILQRALVTADASSQGGKVHRSRGGLSQLLPDGVSAAVTTKELRYARRDPRRRVTWISSLALCAVLAFSTVGSNGLSGQQAVLALTCLIAAVLPGQHANVLGIDGRALWFNVVAFRQPSDLRSDFAGRHLAFAALTVPLLVMVSVGFSLVAGEPLGSVPTLLTALGPLGVGLGASALISVLLPYGVPDQFNAFSNAAPGQGCIAGLSSVFALLLTVALSLPVVVPVWLGATWLCVVGPIYGFLAAWLGRYMAANIGYPRLPETLATVAAPA